MKSSLALVLAGSLLAVAKPIDKRAIYTDYVTDIVTVTVTVDESFTYYRPNKHTRTKAAATTTSSSTSTSSSSSSTPTPTTTTSTTPVVVVTPTTTSTTPAAPTTTVVVTPTTSSTTPEAVVVTTVQAAAEPTTTAAAATTEAKTTSTSAKATSTTAAAAEPTDYSSTAIYHHNIHRSNHSAPAASWDSELASYAATVASSCVYGHDLTPGGGGYGQNIAMAGSTSASASDDSSTFVAQATTDMWYNGEVWQFPSDGYGQSTPDMTNFESWGHFSQVVWAASTSVGCASQFCAAGTMNAEMGAWFTVCNYRSTGNVGGSYGENVLPSLGEATVTA